MEGLIHWGPQYELGIELIDRQHKQLVSFINCLGTAISYGDARLILDGLLEQLLEQAERHFSAERDLMDQSGYPGAADHSAQHDRLIERVRGLCRDFGQDKNFGACREVYRLLKEWLLEHDLKEDRAYLGYVKAL